MKGDNLSKRVIFSYATFILASIYFIWITFFTSLKEIQSVFIVFIFLFIFPFFLSFFFLLTKGFIERMNPDKISASQPSHFFSQGLAINMHIAHYLLSWTFVAFLVITGISTEDYLFYDTFRVITLIFICPFSLFSFLILLYAPMKNIYVKIDLRKFLKKSLLYMSYVFFYWVLFLLLCGSVGVLVTEEVSPLELRYFILIIFGAIIFSVIITVVISFLMIRQITKKKFKKGEITEEELLKERDRLKNLIDRLKSQKERAISEGMSEERYNEMYTQAIEKLETTEELLTSIEEK